MKVNTKSLFCEAESTIQHWEKSTYAQYIAVLPFLLSAALCISQMSPLQPGSILCPLWWGVKDAKICRANKSQAALDAEVLWVPKYFWYFKFYKHIALRLSENWKQRAIMHTNILNPVEIFNKIKNSDTCWKKYF